jgi:O-antigen ligase
MAVAVSSLSRSKGTQENRDRLAYVGLLLFMMVYCSRPNDWLPGAGDLPFAKITGLVAIAGFGLTLLQGRAGFKNLPRPMIWLLLLFAQLCLAIPFGIWPGGSFEVVFTEFWKAMLVSVIIATVVVTPVRLRRVIFIQTASVTLMSFLAVLGLGVRGGPLKVSGEVGARQMGVVGGVFSNPNDFAFSLALVWPFALAFMLRAKNPIVKAFWAASLAAITYALMGTYSRGGFLALSAVALMAVWEFGVKQKRNHLVAVFVLGAVVMLAFASPAGYGQRLKSIFFEDLDPTRSSDARKDILILSLSLTARHPLFGIGPGNFPVVGGWHVSHNTYTQFSSEAGIPAVVLFVLCIYAAFGSARRASELPEEHAEVKLMASAIRASLTGLAVGAFFASVAYHFFPYFLLGYASALDQIQKRIGTPSSEDSERDEVFGISRIKLPKAVADRQTGRRTPAVTGIRSFAGLARGRAGRKLHGG